MTITVLLLLHGLGAVFLLGAVSHQAIGVWKTKPLPAGNFFQSLINVRGASYTNAIVVLYIVVSIGGAIIYPAYVMDVKASLNDARMLSAIGAFEIKEHFAIVGIAILPTYWYFWKRKAPSEELITRRLVTSFLAALVWWNFMIGHILNNIKGLI